MSLNFTGRLPPPEDRPPVRNRTPVFILGCFGAAALLAGLVFAVALRQHGAETTNPAPPLTGVAVATPQAQAAPVAPSQPAPVQQAAAPSPPPAAKVDGPRERMLAILRRSPGYVSLVVEQDGEAEAYANQLAHFFHDAGWRVDLRQISRSGPPLTGVWANLGGSPSDQAIHDAFAAIGAQLPPPPPDAGGIMQTPEIHVGAHPTGR